MRRRRLRAQLTLEDLRMLGLRPAGWSVGLTLEDRLLPVLRNPILSNKASDEGADDGGVCVRVSASVRRVQHRRSERRSVKQLPERQAERDSYKSLIPLEM